MMGANHDDAVRESAVGVVLCGGASRRMGTDKASLQVGETLLLDRAINALSGVTAEVVLACGVEPRYVRRGLRLVLDTGDGRGPLEGVAASLESCDVEWAAVLACDLPRITPEVPTALLERARSEQLDVCLLESARGK